MILAAGLTPAWQQIVSLREFVPGEVNRSQLVCWCASGKVLNVGCALHHLGVPSKTLCLIGGVAGNQIRSDFEHLHVPVRWVETQTPTRICTTILDELTGVTTELVENSRQIPSSELAEYLAAYHEEAASTGTVVISGSLPEGAPADYYRQMLEVTVGKAVLDVRGKELDAALELKPFVVKPNREELMKTVGRPISTEDELVEAMAELRSRGAEWVVVSNGPSPLLALGPDGLIRIQPPEVAVRNPIGCGDCLAAGIAAGIDQGFSVRDAIELGVRAAAENAQELLPARKLTRLA